MFSFDSQKQSPNKNFIFLIEKAHQFQEAILQIEDDLVSAIQAAVVLDKLKTNLKTQNEHGFTSFELKSDVEKVANGPKKLSFKREMKHFYDESDSYITKWTPFLNDFKLFAWTLLNQNPVWNDTNNASCYW